MTVKMDCDEQGVCFQIEGDIYEEHAECLCSMVNSQVQRGIKELEIQLFATYYISSRGQQCLQGLKDMLGNQGIFLSFKGQSVSVN